MDRHERLHVEALRKCPLSLEETIGRPHFLAVEMPQNQAWDKVRDEVSRLDCRRHIALPWVPMKGYVAHNVCAQYETHCIQERRSPMRLLGTPYLLQTRPKTSQSTPWSL